MSELKSILEPGVKIIPQITINESKQLVENLYGLQCKSIIELNAYEDKNYKITVDDDFDNDYIPNICPDGYVLKILNNLESKKIHLIQGQNELMLFLDNKHNMKCSKPVRNKNGQYLSVENINGEKYVVRLMEFIPGPLFCNVQVESQLLYDSGVFLAKMTLILKEFYHSAFENSRSMWMLDSLPQLRQFLYVIDKSKDAKMINEIITKFEETVLVNLHKLETGILHGDFNEQNIIVKCVGDRYTIGGILDFGDSQYSCLLFELAVAATYMILQSKNFDLVSNFFAGYQTIRPIPDFEWQLLKVCIAGRFCQSLVLGIYTNLQFPDNKYVLSSQKVGWQLLRMLWHQSNEDLIQKWQCKTITKDNLI